MLQGGCHYGIYESLKKLRTDYVDLMQRAVH